MASRTGAGGIKAPKRLTERSRPWPSKSARGLQPRHGLLLPRSARRRTYRRDPVGVTTHCPAAAMTAATTFRDSGYGAAIALSKLNGRFAGARALLGTQAEERFGGQGDMAAHGRLLTAATRPLIHPSNENLAPCRASPSRKSRRSITALGASSAIALSRLNALDAVVTAYQSIRASASTSAKPTQSTASSRGRPSAQHRARSAPPAASVAPRRARAAPSKPACRNARGGALATGCA